MIFHMPSAWIYILAVAALTSFTFSLRKRRSSAFPLINYDSSWTQRNQKTEFVKRARELLIEGSQKFSGPFRLFTDAKPVVILPPSMIDAINAEERLSFDEFVREKNMSDFDTFRTMRNPPLKMFAEAVLKGITRALPRYTKPLSLEMTSCLNDTWSTQDEWHEVLLMNDVLQWIARLSNRIFLGEEFTRNSAWLQITIDFTVNLFTAIQETKSYAPFLRPVFDLLSPRNQKVRQQYRQAATLLEPALRARTEEIRLAQAENRLPDLPDDSIEWFRQASHGRPYNDLDLQLMLATASIHTTSDLLCQAVLNFCAYPQYAAELRDEIVTVLKKHGLQKVALTELRLLDSFLKETQRLKPIVMTSMHRVATADIDLPGGIRIAKGEQTAISSQRMWDESIYEDPDTFSPFRFAARRKIPGLENKSLLVATSDDHMGFSHGRHACPGRFFAANEVKIAFLHLILKYDMKMDDPAQSQWVTYGTSMLANHEARILVKSRVPEIDLDHIAREL